MTTKLGIGGYFVITQVENIIKRGSCETLLTCSWVYSGFRTSSASDPAADCEIQLNRTYGTTGAPDSEEGPSIGDAIRSAFDESLDSLGDFVLETIY